MAIALICFIVFSGCDAQKTNDALRSSYKQSFLKECERRARGPATEAVARSYCLCVTSEMMKRLSTVDLVELPFHVAPRRVSEKSMALTKRCADAAVAPLYRGRACNAGVRVTYAAQPHFPSSPLPLTKKMTAEIEVTILKNGLVKDPRIHRSSGNSDIDRQAIKAAASTTYWPKFVNCRPVESRYLFKAVFDPKQN